MWLWQLVTLMTTNITMCNSLSIFFLKLVQVQLQQKRNIDSRSFWSKVCGVSHNLGSTRDKVLRDFYGFFLLDWWRLMCPTLSLFIHFMAKWTVSISATPCATNGERHWKKTVTNVASGGDEKWMSVWVSPRVKNVAIQRSSPSLHICTIVHHCMPLPTWYLLFLWVINDWGRT